MVSLIAIAHAQATNPAIAGLLSRVMVNVVNPLIDLIFGFAFLIFIWGVAQYFINDSDGSKRGEGQQHILWGVIGMFIMISVWGIIRFVAGIVGVNI